MKCSICNGTGNLLDKIDLSTTNPIFDSIYYEVCKYCEGTGEVNWIEQIFGKHEEKYPWKSKGGVRPRHMFPDGTFPTAKV